MVAVVGLALVILEAVRTLRSDTLGTLGAVLLYVGLGLFVIAGAVLMTDQGAQPAPVVEDDRDPS